MLLTWRRVIIRIFIYADKIRALIYSLSIGFPISY